MIHAAVGVIGFVLMNLFDLVSLKKVPFGIKPILWASGLGLLIYSVIMLCLESNTLPISVFFVRVGWGLLGISILMIILVLFVNLPLRQTYVDTGSGRLVKTGFYCLVRHPAAFWVATFMFSLVLVSKSAMMLKAAPIFVFLNTLFVVIEDRFFFVKMFQGYDLYKKETPMLLPNRRSLRAFLGYVKGHDRRKV